MSSGTLFGKYLRSFLTKAVILLRSHLRLFLLGVICEFVYLSYLLHDFPVLRYFQDVTLMGNITGHSFVSFHLFLVAFTFLFVIFGLAWWQVYRFQDRATLWIILGFGSIFALTTTFVYPLTSVDVFLYIARSLIMVKYGADPMIVPPIRFAADPLMMQLTRGFTGWPSAYGPLCLFIQALPVLIAGKNILVSLLLTKIMFSSILILSALFIYKILSQIAPRFALSGALALTWNPFALFQYSVNSHNDIAMMFFVALAVFALLKERPVLAMALVTASVLVKYASLPLIPLFFIYSFVHQPTWPRRMFYIIHATIYSLTLIIGSFALFWKGPQTLERLFHQVQNQFYSFNMFLYYFSSGGISLHEGKLIGLALFGVCFLYALWLSAKGFSSLLKGCFITMFALLALGATYVQPWYFIWPFMLAMLVPQIEVSLAAILFVYAGTLAGLVRQYLLPWESARHLNMYTAINGVVYLIFFFPPVLLLLIYRFRHIFSRSCSSSYSDDLGSLDITFRSALRCFPLKLQKLFLRSSSTKL